MGGAKAPPHARSPAQQTWHALKAGLCMAVSGPLTLGVYDLPSVRQVTQDSQGWD